MANKPAARKSAKEIKEEKSRRWLQIGLALLLVLIMVMAVFQAFFSGTPGNGGSTDTGKGKFNSIVDALNNIPQGVEYLRYVDLTANQRLSNWTTGYIGGSIPNASIFGKTPQKDALALYPFPFFGYFDESMQWVSLSDFGPGFDNANYTTSTVNGVSVRMINSVYAFSPGTTPVVSGKKENVAAIATYISQNSATPTAYGTYSDLFQQVASRNQTAKDARFAVVGQTSAFGVGDRYYAGITPLNDSVCDYKIVVHLNQSLNLTEQQRYATTWTNAALQFGLDMFSPEFTDNYLIVEARGSPEICMNDLVTNWPAFMQG